MPQKPRFRAVAAIDPGKLAEFQAGIRKRYSDEQILAELRACAERLGKSPTMREFATDSETTAHPQTVIEHFGSWNAAKRAAGLVPRRFATRDELLGLLRELGEELGRPPTARDIDEHKGRLPSKSLYWHTFGSLTNALREAGFDVPVGEERLERAVPQNVVADTFEQLLLLAGRHDHLFDVNHLADDVANFRAGLANVHPRELRDVDDVDQSAEYLALQIIFICSASIFWSLGHRSRCGLLVLEQLRAVPSRALQLDRRQVSHRSLDS